MNIDSSLYLKGFLLSVFAGILWSFGPILVLHMQSPEEYRLQYLFYRGIGVTGTLLIYLFIREGISCFKNFSRIGWEGMLGGTGLGFAMFFFIYSITLTSAAVTLFMLAAMPFMTAILGNFVLGERLKKETLLSMVIAFSGVLLIAWNDAVRGTFLGAAYGFLAAIGFSIFTLSLRMRKDVPKFTTVIFGGSVCSVIALVLVGGIGNVEMPSQNILLSFGHGALVGSGLILYSIGAKYLPAAELVLLSLLEIAGGILWVAVPFFGISQIPTITTMMGGTLITAAVLLNGYLAKPSIQLGR